MVGCWCFFKEGDPPPRPGCTRRPWPCSKARPGSSPPRSAAKPPRSARPTKRERADRCADYLLDKRPYLDYPTALTNGWPIATGVIEGACRHFVKDRMDITGARWGLAGAEGVLRLRALSDNGDFDQYWTLPPRTRTTTANHASRYANGVAVRMRATTTTDRFAPDQGRS